MVPWLLLATQASTSKNKAISFAMWFLKHEPIVMNRTTYEPQSKSLIERNVPALQVSLASVFLPEQTKTTRTTKVPSVNFCDEMSSQTILRLCKLKNLLGISRSTVYLRINPKSKYYDPVFPKPIRLGAKAVGWVLSDVCEYIEHLKKNKKVC